MELLENKKVEKLTIVNVLKDWFDENPVKKMYELNDQEQVELVDGIVDHMSEFVYDHQYSENLKLSDQDYIIDCIKLYCDIICSAITKFRELTTPEMFDIDMDLGYDEYTRDLIIELLKTHYNIDDECDTTDDGYYLLHNLVANELHRLYWLDYAKYLVYNKPIVGSTDNKHITRFSLDDYDYRALFEAGYFDFMACNDIANWNCTYDIIAIMLNNAPECDDSNPTVGQIIGYNYGLTDCRTAYDAFIYNLDSIKRALREIVERQSELNSNSTLADVFKLLTNKYSV